MHLAQILPQKLVPLLVHLDEEEEDEVEDKGKLYSLTIRYELFYWQNTTFQSHGILMFVSVQEYVK